MPVVHSDKVLSVFDGALQKAALSSLTERVTKLIDEGLIEVWLFVSVFRVAMLGWIEFVRCFYVLLFLCSARYPLRVVEEVHCYDS